MTSRADRHRNPTAFTTDVAHTGGLVLGVDYEQGDPFTVGSQTYYTARLLGDPLALTIRVIDVAGWQTHSGGPRWSYADMPNITWSHLSPDDKARVIGRMYLHHEMGTEMAGLFPA